MNKLTVGTSIFQLPDELFWEDEFDFTPGSVSIEYSLTGALIVSSCVRAAGFSGRPITLTTPEQGGWMTRADLEALYATLSTTATLVLELHGARTFNVAWRHADTPISASLLFPGLAYPTSSTWYTVTLRFLQV